MKARKTNAVRLLDRAGIAYELVTYDLPPEGFSAQAVAEQVNLPAETVFKTLIAGGDTLGPCFAVVPGNRDLDLRALAIARGERKMSMVPLKEVEQLTGYLRGAVTVLGAKRPYPAVVDRSAMGLEAIAVSAGARGLQMVLAPEDYLAITGALVTAIAR
jgi:Cys-tRNA(Pro)/Cys-tRNA(Cys) deacylase